MSEELLPCKICGRSAAQPPPVDGGDHQHHQVVCNDCGIEVVALTKACAHATWNKLMAVAGNG